MKIDQMVLSGYAYLNRFLNAKVKLRAAVMRTVQCIDAVEGKPCLEGGWKY